MSSRPSPLTSPTPATSAPSPACHAEPKSSSSVANDRVRVGRALVDSHYADSETELLTRGSDGPVGEPVQIDVPRCSERVAEQVSESGAVSTDRGPQYGSIEAGVEPTGSEGEGPDRMEGSAHEQVRVTVPVHVTHSGDGNSQIFTLIGPLELVEWLRKVRPGPHVCRPPHEHHVGVCVISYDHVRNTVEVDVAGRSKVIPPRTDQRCLPDPDHVLSRRRGGDEAECEDHAVGRHKPGH